MRKVLLVSLLLLLPVTDLAVARGALICGAVARRNAGNLPPTITGTNGKPCGLNLARNWAACLPHVSMQDGAFVVQGRKGRASDGSRGAHVSQIVRTIDSCHAVVRDEKGEYERDVCKGRIAVVKPEGGGLSFAWHGGSQDMAPALMMR